MIKNPSIYEINTRVFIKRFENYSNSLNDIPTEYWLNLKNLGIDYIWLMGIWKTNPETISRYCFEEGLMSNYDRALRDWKKKDVIGSPYAIDDYIINPLFGTEEMLIEFKNKLNSLGLKLILDFIPNHFSCMSHLINKHPELFLETIEEHYQRDPHTYFHPEIAPDKIYAHGRDPFFPSWQDTIQVNYFNPLAQELMIEKLRQVSKLCDGVRCDMAMLALNNIFENTWGGTINIMGYQKPENEFWEVAINKIKVENKNFIFIAEAYWNLEWKLQKLGFDFTYDKKLTDRLRDSQPTEIAEHLKAEIEYQNKSLRFIENHDEERAIKSFGVDKSKAAAVIMSSILGLRFFHDGQFEGKKIKLPVQLGREPSEKNDVDLMEFYNNLLKITKEDVFKYGNWELIETTPAWENDNIMSFKSFLAFKIELNDERRLIVVNYDARKNSCRIKLDLNIEPNEIILVDLWDSKEYIRTKEEIENNGLFVELEGYKTHIFRY